MQGWAMIAVVAIVATTLSQIARAKYGGGRDRPGRRSVQELEDRLVQVEQELQAVRQELTETQERVDFTERLLARQKDTGKLGA